MPTISFISGFGTWKTDPKGRRKGRREGEREKGINWCILISIILNTQVVILISSEIYFPLFSFYLRFLLSQLQDFLILDTPENPDSLLWESLWSCYPVTVVHSDSVPLNCPLNNWIIYSTNTQQSKLCTRYCSTHWAYKQWTKVTQIPAYSELTHLLRLNLGWLWFHAFSSPPLTHGSASHLWSQSFPSPIECLYWFFTPLTLDSSTSRMLSSGTWITWEDNHHHNSFLNFLYITFFVCQVLFKCLTCINLFNLLTIPKMRKQNFGCIYWPIDDSEVVTCPNSPAEKWQTWLCLPVRDNLASHLLQVFLLPLVMFLPIFPFSQDHLKCVPCHTNYPSLSVLLSYLQWNFSVALGQGQHLASTTYSIPAWGRRRYLGSILSNCKEPVFMHAPYISVLLL